MATKVVLPLLGQTMEEGTINKWFKQEGEAVEKGEPLLEVMTDKVNMEVESPASGVLRKIVAPEQAVVPVKELIAIIGEPDEKIDDLLAGGEAPAAPQAAEVPAPEPAQAAPSVPAPAPPAEAGRVIASPRARKVAGEHGLDIALLAGMGSGPGGRIVEKDVMNFLAKAEAPRKVTPLAEKVAADLGVDLTAVAGSGPGGKITREDVMRATPVTPSAPLVQRPGLGAEIPLTGIRKAVAQAMSQSASTAPQVTLVSEVDMSEISRLRDMLNKDIEPKYGIKLSFTDIIVKAVALAIEDHPIINSSLEADRIVIHDDVHVCVAIAVEGGLLAPVVKNTRSKPLHVISAEIKQLAEKARTGRLSTDEMSGGTITVTNLGSYGVDLFTPIINPPQSAIMGVGRIAKRPVVVGDQVQVRPMMNLCLVFDHRVVDGAPAAQYLARVKELLENPYLMLA